MVLPTKFDEISFVNPPPCNSVKVRIGLFIKREGNNSLSTVTGWGVGPYEYPRNGKRFKISMIFSMEFPGSLDRW